MAATELLAVGSTAASSSDFTLAVGEAATIALKGFGDPLPTIVVELKTDDAAYLRFAVVKRQPVLVSGPGTFRVSRLAGASGGASRG